MVRFARKAARELHWLFEDPGFAMNLRLFEALLPFTMLAGLIVGITSGVSIAKCIAYVLGGILAAQLIAMCLNFRLHVVHEDEEAASLDSDQQQA